MIIASHLFKIICVPGTVLSTVQCSQQFYECCCIPSLQMGMLRSRKEHLFAQGHTASHSPLKNRPFSSRAHSLNYHAPWEVATQPQIQWITT